MLRDLSVALALWFFPAALAAQTTAGPVLGVTVTTFSGDGFPDSNFSARANIHLGALVEHRLRGAFLRSGLVFYQQGAHYQSGNQRESYTLSTLTIPAVVGIELPLERPVVQPRLFGGFQVGFDIGCHVGLTIDGIPKKAGGCEDGNLGLQMTGAELSWLLGGGVTYALGRGHLLVDVLYHNALTDAGKNLPGFKNRGGTVAVGYLLPLAP